MKKKKKMMIKKQKMKKKKERGVCTLKNKYIYVLNFNY